VPVTEQLPIAVPRLAFTIEAADSLAHAAVPTIRFGLRIDAGDHVAVRSILLDVQVQIAARQRGYAPGEQDRLLELFGTPDRWRTTLRTLPWTRATVVVPQFDGGTRVDVLVPCTYDFEVAGARYLAALEQGDVPLEFLFSGSVFFTGAGGLLQTARISWDSEAAYRLPVSVWRETMDRNFPDSAWVRLGRGSFDRLSAYKARHAHTSWDAAIDALLGEAAEDGL
jgi:hypothetical protein